MSILNKITSVFARKASKKTGKRAFAAASHGRLNGDWAAQAVPINVDLRTDLRTMRTRARELAQNSDYIKAFLGHMERGVVGTMGIRLRSKAVDTSGSIDVAANKLLDAAWAEFSLKKNFDVRQMLNNRDFLAVYLRTLLVDGEVFVRKVKGYRKSKHRYALQILDSNLVDERLNFPAENIRMGIQYDEWGCAIAYLIRETKQSSDYLTYEGRKYVKIPASEIHHGFLIKHADQGRGYPWLHTVVSRLHQLEGYEEAELVAARVGASAMGFFTTPEGDSPIDDDAAKDGDDYIMDADPGTFRNIPAGAELQQWDPKHPAGNFGVFMKACLRGISSGLELGYNTIASDLEGVNYTSLRAGNLQERDVYKSLQKWLSDNFLTEIHAEWLDMVLIAGQVNLPVGKYDKFLAASWQGRGWDWVDPDAEITAKIKSIEAGLTTRRQVIEESGGDFEEVMQQLAAEQAIIEKYGVNILTPSTIQKEQAQAGKGVTGNKDGVNPNA